MTECLAIDSGGCLWMNSLCALIAIWLQKLRCCSLTRSAREASESESALSSSKDTILCCVVTYLFLNVCRNQSSVRLELSHLRR